MYQKGLTFLCYKELLINEIYQLILLSLIQAQKLL